MVAVGSAGESGVGVNDDVALEQLVVAEVVLGPGVDEQVLRRRQSGHCWRALWAVGAVLLSIITSVKP